MKKIFIISAVILFTSFVLAASSSSAPDSRFNRRWARRSAGAEGSLAFDGRIRTYIVHVPPSYNGKKPVPLVVVLHGGGSNAQTIERTTGFSLKSDREGFIVVYPNGTGKLKDGFLTWNAGNCCGYALENNVDDVGFIRRLIERLEGRYSIDKKRIYATGISNGAMMSYRLACELSDKIAAIGPVAGAMNLADPQPTDAVSAIIFHGTDDMHVLYEGGEPKKSVEKRKRIDNPVSYAVSFWVRHNGCSDSPKREEQGNIIHEAYGGGRNGTAVELYTVSRGTHAWPGGLPGWQGGDIPTREISATDTMWEFFKRHQKG